MFIIMRFDSFRYSWRIPITYGSAQTVNWTNVDIVWMVNKKMNQTMNISSDDWYLVNVNQGGFYRVHYADNNWILLINQLQRNFTAIPVFSRAQILNDLFSLANHHIVPYTLFLNATRYLNREDEFLVWITVSRSLLYINNVLALNENYDDFQAYLRTLIDNRIRSANWSFVGKGQDLPKIRFDYTVTKLACIAEHHLCVNKTSDLFRRWMSKPETNPIRPDLRFITYCTAIRHGGHVEWKFLESQLTLNDFVNEEETENKMLALTCSRDKEILKEYLERVRENENFWFTLDYFAKSPVGNQLLWDHLSDVPNFDKHEDFTESILNALTKYPYSLFSGRNYEKILLTEANNQIDPEHREKLKYLFEISSGKRTWTEVYSAIIQWLKENVPIVTQSL